MMNIGSRIVARLDELGWKRKDLLDALPELTPQALSALIKRGSKRSELDEYIASGLGVSVMWLVYGKGVENAPNLPASVTKLNPPTERDAWMAELTELAEKLDTYRMGMLIKTARDLVAEQPAKQTPESS